MKTLSMVLIASLILALPTLAQPLRFLSFFSIVKLSVSVLFFFLPVLFIGRLKRLYFLFSLSFLALGIIELGYFFIFNASLGSSIIGTALATNIWETFEFIMQYGLSALVITATLSFMYVYLIYKMREQLNFPFAVKIISGVLYLSIITYSLLTLGQVNYLNSRVFPFTTLNKSVQFLESRQIVKSFQTSRSKFHFDVDQSSLPEQNIVVVVIGESASRHHFSLYDYKYETTPELKKFKDLIVFKNAISPATRTIQSLMFSLSEATPRSPQIFYKKKSIIGLANDAGYETYWISNQYGYGEFETETTIMANEAKHRVFLNDKWRKTKYDSELLPAFKQVFAKEKKQLIILHTMGSHGMYVDRYPEDFEKKVINIGSQNKIVKTYDISIRYTDYFLSSVLNFLKDDKRKLSKSFLFFSDHAEELFNDKNKQSGHGLPILTKSQVDIPLLYWGNRKIKTVDVKISLSDSFYAISDLLSIHYKGMKKNRSFLSNDYIESSQDVVDINGNVKQYKDL